MSIIRLTFEPSAEHVRTARLVAVAVARRSGLSESRLDEIRLAVGEVCARAVRRSRAAGVTTPMTVELDDRGPHLEVVVTDHAGEDGGPEEPVALALVEGLTDRLSVEDGPRGAGGVLRLQWDTRPHPRMPSPATGDPQ